VGAHQTFGKMKTVIRRLGKFVPLLLLQWSLISCSTVHLEANEVVLQQTVWRSEKFDSEWGKAYFELKFLDAERCEWKALSPEQKEPMFSYVGGYALHEGTINFRMGDEIRGEGQVGGLGRSFVFIPTQGDDRVKFHKLLLQPRPERAESVPSNR
jgi:hypothetical protein